VHGSPRAGHISCMHEPQPFTPDQRSEALRAVREWLAGRGIGSGAQVLLRFTKDGPQVSATAEALDELLVAAMQEVPRPRRKPVRRP
jgi:hypothetical protein